MQTMKTRPIEFGDEAPGTILRDFQAMLDIIGPEGLRIAGDKGLFPMDRLAELDARLAAPLKPSLKRPQLRSYPNIAGLYMLLRSSGMGLIQKQKGRGTRLVLNNPVVERWRELSAADRYWNLLGVWWLLAREPGDDRALGAFQALRFAMEYLANAPSDGSMYGRWMPQFALMAMFGMIRFSVVGKSKTEGDWDCEYEVLPLGQQLRDLIRDQDRSLGLVLLHVDQRKSSAERMGFFREQLKAVAPQWKELLLRETRPERFTGTFTVRISLGEVWRRIKIPADRTLDELAYAALEVFDFDDDHLYEFRMQTPTGEEITYAHPAAGEGVPADEMELGDMGLSVGQKITFEYDFGSDWTFDILIEAMDGRQMKSIREIDGEGEAPQQYPDLD